MPKLPPLHKYPRTHHIEGSRLQPGDEDLEAVPFSRVRGRHVVVEEKVDGANAALSFAPDGQLLLQSRGHYLTGGPRERHFALFKTWAQCHAPVLRDLLGSRYVVYGEWLYARHTIFYNCLPHYFMEFDVLDRETGTFLDTPRRAALLRDSPIVSVRVLHAGTPPLRSRKELDALKGASAFIAPPHLDDLLAVCEERGLDSAQALRETDLSTDMEGLYLKVEEDGVVRERYKDVRASFLTTVLDSGSHWLARPILPNQLREGVDLFGGG